MSGYNIINMKYCKQVSRIIQNPNLLRPKISCRSVLEIDYDRLQSMGIEYIVFDKDNTLTITHQNQFFSKEIEEMIKNID